MITITDVLNIISATYPDARDVNYSTESCWDRNSIVFSFRLNNIPNFIQLDYKYGEGDALIILASEKEIVALLVAFSEDGSCIVC